VQLAAGTITAADIASGAVTEAKLDPLSGSTGALNVKRVATFIFDSAVSGITQGTYSTGVALPAKAVITRSYFKIITQFVDAGAGTIAIFCEDANNIKTATDITGSAANAFVEGQSTGAASAFVRAIGAACNISVVIGGVDVSAGKLIGWVEYVVED
jgi:hypothetical protein